MMKGQMTNMLPSILMMTFVSFFFSGYVISKVPFPLTPKFKMMLQQGVQLSTLDSSYVSSLSWYFLVMFGLNGVYTLLLGSLPSQKPRYVEIKPEMAAILVSNLAAMLDSNFSNTQDLQIIVWKYLSCPKTYVQTLLLGSLPPQKPRYVEIKPEMAAILDSNMAAILDSNIANIQDLQIIVGKCLSCLTTYGQTLLLGS